MIAFASLFLGLVFGLQSVDLVPGDGVTAVELRLDGAQVAMLHQAPWSIEVDFGDELTPQYLEAIAYDDGGRETGRASQWLNLPTEGAALSIVLEPKQPGQPRVALLSWESTAGAEPQSVKASLDGKPLVVEDLRRLVLPSVDESQLHLLSVEMRFEGVVSSRVDFTFGGAYSDQVNTEMTAVPVWSTGKGGTLTVDKMRDWFRVGDTKLSVVAVEKGDAEVVMVMGRAFPRFLGPGERYKGPKNLKLPKALKVRFLAPRPEQTQGVSTQFELFPISAAYGADTGDVYELLAFLMGPPKKEKLQLGSAVAVAGLSAYESRKRRAVVLIPSSVEESKVGIDAGRARRYLERLGVPFYVWDPKGSVALEGWGTVDKNEFIEDVGQRLFGATGRFGSAVDRLAGRPIRASTHHPIAASEGLQFDTGGQTVSATVSLKSLRLDVFKALTCAVVLGILSTFGDWLWTHYIPDGAVLPGIVHGAVVFLAMAAVLAWASGSSRAWRVLLPSLPVLGIVVAAAFYPIAMLTGYLPALLITWIAMWLGTSWLHNRARSNSESFSRALLRGTNAALFSGVAFWLIAGIWTQPAPDGPNYLLHFASWTFAFLPGFLSLLLLQPPLRPATADQVPRTEVDQASGQGGVLFSGLRLQFDRSRGNGSRFLPLTLASIVEAFCFVSVSTVANVKASFVMFNVCGNS